MSDIKDFLNERRTLINEIVSDELYAYLKDRCEGLNDIYDETILALVGSYGLVVLKDAGLLERRDVVNGRQVYALCEMKGED